MSLKRTDLAAEARALWNESAGEKTKLRGVVARDYIREGCAVTRIDIKDEEGAEALGKPPGTYVTVEIPEPSGTGSFSASVTAVAEELAPLLESIGTMAHVMLVGLGNRAVTPDAIGPAALGHLMVTRHLRDKIPEAFSHLRPVSALIPGVLGTTGLESAEIIRGVAERAKPDLVIVIDALASRSLHRLCRTVQMANTGLVPGSGVGNARHALTRETLGIPVVSMGVPTVVDGATLISDLCDKAGVSDWDEEKILSFAGETIVTPKDIDQNVADMAKIIGYALNMALHRGLTVEDTAAYLSS